MTLVDDPAALPATGRPGPMVRVWSLPLRAHLAALAIVLLALMPVIGMSASFSADEGAAIVEARSLSRANGWIVEHPVPEADPEGAAYPIELSEGGPKGTAPLVAAPVVLAGLTLAGRGLAATTTARLAALTAGVFALCVLATRYSVGGSGEWGGRYLAVGLPVAVPVPVLSIRRRASKSFVCGLLVCCLALGVMAVGSLRSAHRFGAGLIAAIHQTAGPDRPVLVTTAPLLPRMAWARFDDQRWLLSEPAALPGLVDRLERAGIERFTFVGKSDADVARLPAALAREASDTYGGWQILVFRTS